MTMFNKFQKNGFVRTELFRICALSCRQVSIEIREDNPKELISSKSDSKVQRLYIWGLADHGALGEIKIRSQKTRMKFVERPVRKVFAFEHKILDFSGGYGFTLYAVKNKSKNKLFGSGVNTDGQIGYHAVRRDHPLQLLFSIQPIKVPLKSPGTTNVTKVAAGRAHSIVLTDEEGVFSLGNNAFGQCGRPVVQDEDYTVFRELHRIKLLFDEPVTDVVCGQDHSLFLTSAGTVYSFGCGSDGQTGLGHLRTNHLPTLVEGDIKGEKIVKLSSSADTVLALSDKGEVFGWGNSEYYQIPNMKEMQQIHRPMHIKRLSSLGKIIDIAAGGTFCMALTEAREVFVWGYGILGRGPKCQELMDPQQIPEALFGRNQFNTDVTVESIYCGIGTLGAVTNKGDLYMWGKNKYGQLGLGMHKDQYFPLRVSMGGRVQKISCGADHTLAMCKPYT